jgi:hypothetical protein
MRRKNGSLHPVARRVVMGSMSVLAASGIGLVAAPMAFGQIAIQIGGQSAGVTNSGSASANTGGNTAIGNNSSNTLTVGGSGGLVNVPVDLGGSTNTSSESTAAITTGPANAVGNSSGTGVGQSNASGNQVNSFLAGQNQSSGVTNSGSASANTGGNTAIGNNSTNIASLPSTSGGLAGVGVTLGGSVNNSTGSATINTGAANAVGNDSATNVGQASLQGGGGPGGGGPGGGGPGGGRPGVAAVGGIGGAGVGTAPCSSGRFAPFQEVGVRNQGQANANTGDNTAIGNNSANTADLAGGSGQTVSGGLLGVGISIGGPVNNSSGSAVINTGPANAVGNFSDTTIGQTQSTCPQVLTVAGRPGVIVPAGVPVARAGTLARTGLDTGDLGMIAGALVGAGMLLVASQRRRMVARSAGVPMAGFGLGMGTDDWDQAIR